MLEDLTIDVREQGQSAPVIATCQVYVCIGVLKVSTVRPADRRSPDPPPACRLYLYITSLLRRGCVSHRLQMCVRAVLCVVVAYVVQ